MGTSTRASLLDHAKLYVLAERYMIKELQDICLHKPHRNLVDFKVVEETIDHVIELIEYTYANTSDGGDISQGSTDRLRDLVISFVKFRYGVLHPHSAFGEMVDGGSAYMMDLISVLGQHS